MNQLLSTWAEWLSARPDRPSICSLQLAGSHFPRALTQKGASPDYTFRGIRIGASFRILQPLLIGLLLTGFGSQAQQSLNGRVLNKINAMPLEGVTVEVAARHKSAVSNEAGVFLFRNFSLRKTDTLAFSAIGFAGRKITVYDLQAAHNIVELTPEDIQLKSITLSSRTGDQYRAIGRADIAMRGVNNSQEVLRIIPGIVIGQHQGGGKAEQIFLRGFDADHGTDFRLDVDGIPVNMVSHAHGQGFADSHFIIPETIDQVDFKKGPYTASKGDFATTGYADFVTRSSLRENTVKLEGGQFNTFRMLVMANLLNKQPRKSGQSWYLASEYRYSDAFFDNPQHFNRFNFFTRFDGKISRNSKLNLSATTFWSRWDASGQVPSRAVEKGLIGFYGALDPSEGGITDRTNVNAVLITSLANGDMLKNQVYFSRSHFDLHTNFTFYLEDTVNGDQIRQREARNLAGYNGTYLHVSTIGKAGLHTEAGLQLRADGITNAELSHTKDRFIILNGMKLGDISQWSIAPYISETVKLNTRLSINAAARFDASFYRYKNKIASDTTLPGTGVYRAAANKISPKLNIVYQPNNSLQLFLSAGRGFHSNDTRSVVVEKGKLALPAAYSADVGSVLKPLQNMMLHAALWYSYLEQEFVYSGDGGFVEFSGPTRRLGLDLSARYEPLKSLYIDMDVNYAHGRALDQPRGANYIPLAPVWTSTGGITFNRKKSLGGSIRYRFVGNRSANENGTLTADGYFITDAVLDFVGRGYEVGLVVNNVFNTRWKETQFDTMTRLKGEQVPVDEVCFTPGTPFSARLSLAIKF